MPRDPIPPLTTEEYLPCAADDLDTEDLLDAVLAWGTAVFGDGGDTRFSVSTHPYQEPLGCMGMLLKNTRSSTPLPDAPRQFEVLAVAHGKDTRLMLEGLFETMRKCYVDRFPYDYEGKAR
jgi:hypothetical protein